MSSEALYLHLQVSPLKSHTHTKEVISNLTLRYSHAGSLGFIYPGFEISVSNVCLYLSTVRFLFALKNLIWKSQQPCNCQEAMSWLFWQE